jgi:hypothetical protein
MPHVKQHVSQYQPESGAAAAPPSGGCADAGTGRNGNGRKRFGAKRLIVAASYVVSLAAVAAVVSGAAFGFFSATSTRQSDSFSAGKVTQTNDLTGVCAVSNLLPNAVQSACTLKVQYTGGKPAYLGLDVLIETQAGSGGTKLYNPADGSHALQVSITSTSPSVTYTLPATATSCPITAPAGSTCYALAKELVSTTAFTNASPQVTFTTRFSLPTTSTTDYQGGAAQIVLTAHATQSANNGSVGGCTAGQTCTGVSWS